MLRILPVLLMFGVGVYAFIDCLTTEETKVRHLPKLAWVFILLFTWWMLFAGPIAWFVAGRPRREAAAGRVGYRRSRGVHIAPDDNPEFLASLNKSNQEHEDMLKKWEEELKQHEDDLHGDDGQGDGRGDGRGGDQRRGDRGGDQRRGDGRPEDGLPEDGVHEDDIRSGDDPDTDGRKKD